MNNTLKKLIVKALIMVLVLSVTLTCVLAAGAGERVYRSTKSIADNLKYINTISLNSEYGREESFALECAPGGDVKPIVMACDTLYGTLTESSVISYAEDLGYNVLGAINSDFFSMATGVPMGMVIENGIYKCSPSGFNAVAFTSDGEFIFSENVQVRINLTNNGGSDKADNWGKTTSLVNFNKYRTSPGGLYLYSEYFSTVSTRTYSDGWFVKFRVLDGGQMRVKGTVELEVVETLRSEESIQIGEGYMVLTAAADSGRGAEFEKYAVGDRVTLTTSCSDERLSDAAWATGSGNLLVRDGVMTDSDGWTDPGGQNPRSAIGVKPDGTIVTYVIDGRDADYSNGLRLRDLAEELMNDGCTYVVNFDGGGSSAISARLPGNSHCSLLNSPSDGAQRGCSTYILFVTDKYPNGEIENLHIDQDGRIVFAGSKLRFTFNAADSGYKPVATPGDIEIYAENGSVAGSIYTAGSPGLDRISLYSSSTGAQGSGEILVVDKLSDFYITHGGEGIREISVMPGETIKLGCEAEYNQRGVSVDREAYTYTVSGGIGTISSDGIFTASGTGGSSGTVTVSAGGITRTVSIKVDAVFSDIVGHWGQRDIEKLYKLGIINGVTSDRFSPDTNIKRGDFVLMLYRAAGSPEPEGTDSFSDVKGSEYYAKAVSWASENGIAQGYGDGRFKPLQPINREQAFTFAYRALNAFGIDGGDADMSQLYKFSDADMISDFAKEPVAVLAGLKIVEGSDGMLKPGANITRAQTAKILRVILETA